MRTSPEIYSYDLLDILIDSFYTAPVLDEWVPYCGYMSVYIVCNLWKVDTHLRQSLIQHWQFA